MKTPNIAIFNFDKLNWWDSKKNDFLPFYPDSNFEYYLNPIWGCNFFGGNIDNSWGSFTSGDTFFIGNYSEAYKQASEHHAVGWDFMLLSVKENGHMIWRYIEYQNFWYTFSLSNVVYAGNITFKILLLLITITLFISSTDDVAMTYGITTLISPLKIFKLPVKEWGIIISLTIRFVPTLVEESKRILNAQASRGVDFKNGNFNDKAKAMTSLIIPMFLLSFIKSNELANAMQARNFTTDTFTTKYKTYNLTYKDFILLAFVFIYLGLLLMFVNQNVLIGNLGLLDLQLLYGV
ncbi:MAG: energy-coupling factor transporter transmembrane protein EcfT [Mycoplasmataceae bacterium]|nr:energy-coupling factor transporter transmembrane protein EcfT [Mycoplasmataceae bacterium]